MVRQNDKGWQIVVEAAQSIAYPGTHAGKTWSLKPGGLQVGGLTVNSGFSDHIVNECDVIDTLGQLGDDGCQRFAALTVLGPFPWGLERLAGGTLEQFDRLAWVPFLIVSFDQFRLEIEKVDVAGSAAHEQLDYPFGLWCMV